MQKISRGRGFRGALNYAFDRDSADVEPGRLLGGNMSGQDARQLAAEFGQVRKLRPDIERPVWHNALRLKRGETLTDAQWVEIADDYMKRMGFTEAHPRAYVLHDDADGQHIHIVASRVSAEGKVFLGQNENLASTRHIQALERDHGLTITKGPTYDPDTNKLVMPEARRLKAGEVERAIRTGAEPPRQKLRQLIDAAKADRPTVAEFSRRLSTAGVGVLANVASTGRLNGFSFELDGVKFKASQLGDKYKWSQLQKEINYDQTRDRAGLEERQLARRHGKPDSKQQHRAGVAGIAATPKRAFTAWRNDRAQDRPGLRVGRCLGPERMPVLRQTRAGNGYSETRHAVLQGTIQRSGGDHRGMQRLPAGGGFYAVESLDRRQAYKASLLQVRYQQQIQAVLAARLAYVDCQQDRIAITLIGGGRVTDHGDRLLTGAGRNQEISAALSLAKSKGWKTLSLSGDDDFKRRAWLEAVRAGLNVVGYEPSPELRAQFHKEKPMLGQAGAGGMMALTPDETMASPSPAASRWLEPLHEAREKLEAERRAIRLQLEGQRSIDLKKLELDLAKQHGGAEYDQVLRNFQAAAAASKDASAFIRIRAESRKEKAWRFLQLAHTKALATPAAAEALAEARKANEMHERLSGRLIPLNFGIGEIDHFQRDIRNGHDPEMVFTKAWRSRQLRPLQLWQELVIQPMFEAAKEQEKARKKAEAEASELARHTQQQEQLYREVDAQKRADELLDVMRTPGLTAAQEETLQDQHRYYTALAAGYDDAEARERAAKKTNAPRPR